MCHEFPFSLSLSGRSLFSFQSIYVMKFFFCLHTAAIAIVIVVNKLECKVITYFILASLVTRVFLKNFCREKKIKTLKIFLDLDTYEHKDVKVKAL